MITPTPIQTKSFRLATYPYGDPSADRVALLLPGKLDTGAYPHMLGHAAHLASQGRYAISFDPPGTRDSDGEIADYCATTYLQAIDELIAYLGNKPTLLVGHSRGGRIAILAGDRNPYVVGSVAAMSG